MEAGSTARRSCSPPKDIPRLRRSCRWSNSALPGLLVSAQPPPTGGAMQEQVADAGEIEKPLWRRIIDFPLVAMLIAVALIVLGIAAASLITKFLLPAIPGLSPNMNFVLV